MTRLAQLIVGILLIVPILFWPSSWIARPALFAVGLLSLSAWGGLWPLAGRRWGSGWQGILEKLFALTLMLLVLLSLGILSVRAQGFPGVLLENGAFVALISLVWAIVLFRFALGGTRFESPGPEMPRPEEPARESRRQKEGT